MNCHTVVFTAKRTNPGEYKHEELVSLVWAIFSKSTLGAEKVKELHDQDVPSPFTWSIAEIAPQEVTISWCSCQDDLIEAFTAALKDTEGEALTVPGSSYLIRDVYVAEDLAYLPKRLTLHALSGIQVYRRSNNKNQPFWFEDDEKDWTNRLERKVLRKANLYGDPEKEHHAHISHVRMQAMDEKNYNGMRFIAPLYSFVLDADEETMQVALYAGVGQNTGTGHGHMVP